MLCIWKALSAFLREDTGQDALPAAIVSIRTAGEFREPASPPACPGSRGGCSRPTSKARRKSQARLIRRVYEVDPLLCRCGERMRVVGFIAQAPVIRKILTRIGRRDGGFHIGQTDPATES